MIYVAGVHLLSLVISLAFLSIYLLYVYAYNTQHTCVCVCAVQEDLAVRLSGLIPKMQQPVAQLYWAAMLHTLRAEWFALDRHRLNKFLMLARKFVAAVFARLAAADW